MPTVISPVAQLGANDIAAAMGRVQAQILWCFQAMHHQRELDIAEASFYDAVAHEASLLCEYWETLRSARNRLVGDDAVAF